MKIQNQEVYILEEKIRTSIDWTKTRRGISDVFFEVLSHLVHWRSVSGYDRFTLLVTAKASPYFTPKQQKQLKRFYADPKETEDPCWVRLKY